MSDASHIVRQYENLWIYTPQNFGSSNTGTGTYTWKKPPGCSFIWIMCIGGGSGGTTGSVANAGIGGGSGVITKMVYQAHMLPDQLYIAPGQGGESMNSGSRSYVYHTLLSNRAPGNSYASIFNVMRVATSGGYPAGGNTAGQLIPGSGEAIVPIAYTSQRTYAGQMDYSVYSSGPDGVDNATGSFTSSLLSGGGRGGATTTSDGQGFSSVNLGITTTPRIVGGTGTVGGNGANGFFNWEPFYGFGGAGGGGSTTGPGGNGGDGGFGCGGGGGGICTSGISQGGRGGDGIVVIATF